MGGKLLSSPFPPFSLSSHHYCLSLPPLPSILLERDALSKPQAGFAELIKTQKWHLGFNKKIDHDSTSMFEIQMSSVIPCEICPETLGPFRIKSYQTCIMSILISGNQIMYSSQPQSIFCSGNPKHCYQTRRMQYVR